jgi:hypothetical protein
LVAALAACGGSSGVGAPPAAGEQPLELAPRGAGWSATKADDHLGEVSNNGAGYTGEVDGYDLLMPAPGRLQVSLSWSHGADFDVILAADPQGLVRLAEGIVSGNEPEYVGIVVGGGQRVHLLVAGWTGNPGPYVLETVLLPPGAPVFDFDAGAAPDHPPSNRPLSFTFNVELDPDQDVQGQLAFVGEGQTAEGLWCIQGASLNFHPRLPSAPGDPGGLVPGAKHTLQFDRAARGLRAVTGEYLTEVVGVQFEVGGPRDFTPGEPPRVVSVSPAPGLPWDGSPLDLTISKPLDPGSLALSLFQVAQDGSTSPLAFVHSLEQGYECDGTLGTHLLVALSEPPSPGSTFRLLLPGTVRSLGGDGAPEHGLTGPFPQAGGQGFRFDFGMP